MKRYSQKGGVHTMAELNITPLLDLAFVLLIIFIITTPLLEQGIQVNLPTAKPAKASVDPKSVKSISVDLSGAIYVGKQAMTLPQLEAELARWHKADPDVAVVLRADKEIRYQKLIDVFDAMQRAQVTRIGLLNNPEEAIGKKR